VENLPQHDSETDDEPMTTIRQVIETFDLAMYGIDPDGADPAWIGDLASAIAGALPDRGSEARRG
jgi:hypothetical protein